MHEQYKLRGDLVRAWLKKEDRKQSYLVKTLNVSQSFITKMLSGEPVRKDRPVLALAVLMGLEVDQLLVLKKTRKAS